MNNFTLHPGEWSKLFKDATIVPGYPPELKARRTSGGRRFQERKKSLAWVARMKELVRTLPSLEL